MGRIIPNEEVAILFTVSPPGAVATPAAPTLATATTGGSLTAGSYSYRVVAKNAFGHTLASAEATQVVPSGTTTNTVTITLPTVTGETAGFDIYGRTTGAELKIGSVAHSTTTFVDTGAVTPAGALPVTNTAYDISHPRVADITGAIDLTGQTMSLNASATGNVVPTPSLDTLFESSIIGTSQATFTGDFYRDDVNDLAWNTLTRNTHGWFIIARFGGVPSSAGDLCEVWPVTVVSRSMANMTNNTVETFTVTCSVPQEPAETATVAA